METSKNNFSAFHQKLANGGSIIVAEGYIFELERRGYLQCGPFVPEIILSHPEVVKSLHEEFVHAGSEVVVALTYYGHREKLKQVGKEDELETLNRRALRIAREVATATGTLLAGDIANSCVYRGDDQAAQLQTEAGFKEQVEWAVEEGVDFIIGETFSELGEALLALKCIQKYGKGVPAVINLVASNKATFDGVPYPEACRKLEEAGAAVVGLNCGRGPTTILPVIKEIQKACKGPISCLPVGYSTSEKNPTMHTFKDAVTGERAFPLGLAGHGCSRTEIRAFAEAAKEIGIQFVGICCGNCSQYTREVAEVYGRTPPSSKFSPDMDNHHLFGDKTRFSTYSTERLAKWKTGL